MIDTSDLNYITIDDEKIYYLYDYIPYNKRDYASKREYEVMNLILNLKYDKDNPHSEWEKNNAVKKENMYKYALKYFYNILVNDKIINRSIDMTICNVPSSKINKDSGVSILVNKIVDNLNSASGKGQIIGVYENGSNRLIRYKDIPAAHNGGMRSKKVHLESIHLIDTKNFQGKNILIIDDVVTTGASMLACIDIIKEAKPKDIRCICLGRTKEIRGI